MTRNVALQKDDDGYHIVVGDDEVGPMTREELREVTNACATAFGAIGEF